MQLVEERNEPYDVLNKINEIGEVDRIIGIFVVCIS